MTVLDVKMFDRYPYDQVGVNLNGAIITVLAHGDFYSLKTEETVGANPAILSEKFDLPIVESVSRLETAEQVMQFISLKSTLIKGVVLIPCIAGVFDVLEQNRIPFAVCHQGGHTPLPAYYDTFKYCVDVYEDTFYPFHLTTTVLAVFQQTLKNYGFGRADVMAVNDAAGFRTYTYDEFVVIANVPIDSEGCSQLAYPFKKLAVYVENEKQHGILQLEVNEKDRGYWRAITVDRNSAYSYDVKPKPLNRCNWRLGASVDD